MTPSQRVETLRQRKAAVRPWHAPPHFASGPNVYLLTAACFEHKPILNGENRLHAFQERLIEGLRHQEWADLRAWVVLPNHYHVLARVDLERFRSWSHRLHNATATQWNREDRCLGRQVWYRFADRRIRGERHYWATVNYVHVNPVRHGWVKKASEWSHSSLTRYLSDLGRERMVALWTGYPVDRYGEGWDE
jgi:putative transposase